MTIDIKKIARDVIRDEARAVQELEACIDDDFEAVVKLVYESKGRVILTGIGKSALIATKIVATLNSTGTPAIFMHAADAIHGDLGMVRPEDVVICLSKSGNTPEIKLLVPLIRNVGNRNIVAMVSDVDSFLAKNALRVLKATVRKEAGALELAPTSSTTAQLVMGDALAMCLIECRNFSSGDFARYHPGGSLGKRLYTRVADVYDRDNRPAVHPSTGIRPLILAISKGRLGAVAVTDNQNKLLGIITDGDLRRMMEKYDNTDGLTAGDIMSPNPKTTLEDELAYNAHGAMRRHSITQLVVTDPAGHYQGIVHLHDILREGIVG
ncbi:MAG: KpsF/GutQ family sugar-phosphate isomerase [Odoribacteraceae bacterium]|nr:KpsF/GutQ family sugar-phosphate isomerase [Odoribacteraceae bacterium]